jgi:hypothetical protein
VFWSKPFSQLRRIGSRIINASGEARVKIAEFVLRQEPQPQPLEIKIVNAKEIGTGVRVLSVKRDDAGKMSGAVVATP